jgi:hypothetical protein
VRGSLILRAPPPLCITARGDATPLLRVTRGVVIPDCAMPLNSAAAEFTLRHAIGITKCPHLNALCAHKPRLFTASHRFVRGFLCRCLLSSSEDSLGGCPTRAMRAVAPESRLQP